MNTPAYAGEPTFAALIELSQRAGFRVEFADIPQDIFARSREDLIQLPTDERFRSEEHAAIVLGHEMAHAFINAKYIRENEHFDFTKHVLLEAECDQLGTYFYLLAKRIAEMDAVRG